MRMLVEDDLHVAVLPLDFEGVARTGVVRHHFVDQRFEYRLLSDQAVLLEVADDEAERRLLHRAGCADRVDEPLPA